MTHASRLRKALAALPTRSGITLIDVGAAGEMQPRWAAAAPNIHYVGFEPDARSRDAIMHHDNGCRSHSIYPVALGPTNGSSPFFLCRKPQLSSFFAPNQALVKVFSDSRRFEVLANASVEVTALDELGFKIADFMKIDVQGGELGVLQGASRILDGLLGLEIEVEFVELYQAQPLFGDVTDFLHGLGFSFIDFVHLNRWERQEHSGYGQCIFGDALFLRTPEAVCGAQPTGDKLDAYLGILLLYSRFDLIVRTLNLVSEAERRDRSSFSESVRILQKAHHGARRVHQLASRVGSLLDPNSRSYVIH